VFESSARNTDISHLIFVLFVAKISDTKYAKTRYFSVLTVVYCIVDGQRFFQICLGSGQVESRA